MQTISKFNSKIYEKCVTSLWLSVKQHIQKIKYKILNTKVKQNEKTDACVSSIKEF